MLYDFSCTPQVFAKEALSQSEGDYFALVTFLNGVINNGMLADLNNGEWKKAIIQNINGLPPKQKDALSKLYTSLKDKNLIVGHVKTGIKPTNEREWIEVAELSHLQRPFFSIVGTDKFDEYVETLQGLLFSTQWNETRSNTHYGTQDIENMRSELTPLLEYARKVVLIDPYFDISKKRYGQTFKLVSELLRNQRGNRQKAAIELHIRYKYGDTDSENFMSVWKRSVQEINSKYGHSVKLFQWDKADSWHDRFLITDQCGVQIGAGLDIRNHGKSTWTKLDYSVLSDVLKDFRENSSSFNLRSTL